MSSISFKSNYIKPLCIQKKSSVEDNYVNSKASLVEIDMTNSSDVSAVDNLPALWGKKKIAKEVKKIYNYEESNTPKHVYAVTLQSSNFDQLNSKKVLGIVQLDTRADNINELDYLQVNPKCAKTYVAGEDRRPYKNIGSSLLNSLKELYPKKRIHLCAIPSAVEFYKNNDFVQTKSRDEQDFTWNA